MANKKVFRSFQQYLEHFFPRRAEIEREKELMKDPYKWGKYCAEKALEKTRGENG